jgi:outer membrane protein assembly factor BamB
MRIARLRRLSAGVLVVSVGLSSAVLWGSPASGVASTSSTSAAATNVLGGPGHNAYTDRGLGDPLSPLWQRSLHGKVATALESDGRVFVQAHNVLYALSAADGSLLWAIDTGGRASTSPDDRYSYPETNAVLDGNTLVSSNRGDGRLVGYDVATGRQRWAVEAPQRPSGVVEAFQAVVDPGDGVVYVGDEGAGTIEARSVSTGALLWSGSGGGWLSYDGGALFTDSGPGCGVQALNPTDGSQLWVTPGQCGQPGLLARFIAVADGDIYDGHGDVLSSADGNKVGSWSGDFPAVRTASQVLTVSDHTLTATDVTSNTVDWSFTGDGHLTGNPLVAGSTVYIATTTGRLYELDLETGQEQTSLSLPAGFVGTPAGTGTSSTAMSLGDGVLYVPTGHVLTAFTPGGYTGPQPSAAPPMTVTMPTGKQSHDVDNYLGNASHDNVTGASALPGKPHLAWSKKLPGLVSAPLITAHHVIVTVGPGSGSEIVSYSRAKGHQQWHLPLPDQLSGSAVISGETVYVQTVYGSLITINLRTGHVRSNLALPNLDDSVWLWGAPLTTYRKSLYVVASGDGTHLFSLPETTGRRAWFSQFVGGNNGAIAAHGPRVFYDQPCESTAFDTSTGSAIWDSLHGCEGGGGITPVVHGAIVYDTDNASPNLEIDSRSGRTLSSYTSDREPAVVGSLMFTQAFGVMRAEDITTHRLLWARSGHFVLPPLVVGRRVIGVTSNGSVLELSALTGHTLWTSPGDNPTGNQFVSFEQPAAPSVAQHTLAVPENDQLVVFTS